MDQTYWTYLEDLRPRLVGRDQTCLSQRDKGWLQDTRIVSSRDSEGLKTCCGLMLNASFDPETPKLASCF